MRIVMMGTGTFAEPTFEALLAAFGGGESIPSLRGIGRDLPAVVGLVTQPERDAGNKRGSTRQTGKGMANIACEAASGFSVAQPESINTPEGLDQLREMRPDLLVVAAYGQILSKDVLGIPTRGTINVHASMLPKYRGAAPVAYAILGGEKQTGVTIIKVTPGLDSGDMILQESLDIAADDTTGSLEAKLSTLGAKLAVEAVKKYAAGGPIEGRKQDPALVTKAPKIKKEFGLIDWTKPAEYIERFVRAMQPWPTAYTFLHRPGKEAIRVIITRATVAGRGSELQPPGAIMSDMAASERLQIAAGPGHFLEVLELQIAGKKRMTAAEFSHGYGFSGDHFGPEVIA